MPNAKYAVFCKFDRRPLGFTLQPQCSLVPEMAHCENAVVFGATEMLRQKGIVDGMFLHSVNGIDVMDCMLLKDVRSLLGRLLAAKDARSQPIECGFIDLDAVRRRKEEEVAAERPQIEKVEAAEHRKMSAKSGRSDHDDDGEGGRGHKGRAMSRGSILSQSTFAAEQDLERKMHGVTYCEVCLSQSTLYFLMMYFFILTDLYCRIYPMLVIGAYTKKQTTDDEEQQRLLLGVVGAGVVALVFAYECIAYKMILLKDYDEWGTVFKQLYFATFTISFFLLSTMGLAYLEKSVNFDRLMQYEYRGRMVIGLLFVMTVIVHQAVYLGPTVDRYDEWDFLGTHCAYFVVLLCSVAAHFYLIHIKKEIDAVLVNEEKKDCVDIE